MHICLLLALIVTLVAVKNERLTASGNHILRESMLYSMRIITKSHMSGNYLS